MPTVGADTTEASMTDTSVTVFLAALSFLRCRCLIIKSDSSRDLDLSVGDSLGIGLYLGLKLGDRADCLGGRAASLDGSRRSGD